MTFHKSSYNSNINLRNAIKNTAYMNEHIEFSVAFICGDIMCAVCSAMPVTDGFIFY